MKLRISLSLITFMISGVVNAANVNQDLCTTTTFQAFGEPKQTIRDCADPYEAFWVAVDINGTHFMPQSIGLIVPLTNYSQHGGKVSSMTVQVTKKREQYTVRFQAVLNNKAINWSGNISPGEVRFLNLNGNKVTVRFARQ